jgi:transposase
MPVQRYLLALRGLQEQGMSLTKGVRTVEMTPRRAIVLMVQRREELTEAQRSALEEVCQLHPQIRLAYSLLEQFAQMLRHRRGEELELWLQAAFHSSLPGMRAFVQKIRQDQGAVQAGLVLKWNNGPVEGQINRLKLLKRSMYGRANFDLLRLRVLDHRKWA